MSVDIKIADYNYNLPDERIAKFPVAERDRSKLLVYNKGNIQEDTFYNIGNYLPKGELMVFNNTKVIRARMHFRKETGALIEIFLLEPYLPADYEQMFQSRGKCQWLCLIGNKKKWKDGELSQKLASGVITLSARYIAPHATSQIVEFSWDSDHSFAEIVDLAGELPIPPYLNRDTEKSDLTTYQTVYSKIKGSVAAPTAGLHFTPAVLSGLDSLGIERDEVTLHVGAGTFKPVKSENVADHEMHAEHFAVSLSTIQNLIKHGGKAIAVGTTSVRTLESLYYIGAQIYKMQNAECRMQNWNNSECRMQNSELSGAADDSAFSIQHSALNKAQPNSAFSILHSAFEFKVSQWEPYQPGANEVPALDALKAIEGYLLDNKLDTLHASTQIIITPAGYDYKIVKMLVTNFHQPQSTLLLLVSALIGDKWHEVYDYALAHDFRFLSYGDSSLLIP